MVIPLKAFQKYFSIRRGAEIRVKVTDKSQLAAAKEELKQLTPARYIGNAVAQAKRI